MNISQSIWNRLLGKQELKKNISETDNAVDSQKNLLNAITTYFKKHFLGRKTFTDTVVLWIDNEHPSYQNYARDKEFDTQLKTEFENKELYAIANAKFVFRTENPPQDLGLPILIEGVYLQLIPLEEIKQEIITKAKITIFNGKGSLKRDKYILDSLKQIEYNIGRGDEDHNHIVINEDDSTHKEANSYVSRQHAKVVFVAEKGFYLQSCNESNRTIIKRNNQRFADLKDLNTRILLLDNDVIELGKSVCLKFENSTKSKTKK